PVSVSGLTGVSAVVAGDEHTCALLAAGTVKCWGENSEAQLGDYSFTNSAIPRTVISLDEVITIASGGDTSCTVRRISTTSRHTLACWGRKYFSSTPSLPNGVAGLNTGVKAIPSVGRNHNCALLADSTVKCWGSNEFGQLGNKSLIGSETPVHAQL
ncbi:MAG: hypothetical protein EXQ63_03800, partial [Ilumatobacteraceae bacterium]|nr:hypothetical protein [Ilumatobacteraceae bacterium]